MSSGQDFHKRIEEIDCDECGEKGMGIHVASGMGIDQGAAICCDCCQSIAQAEIDLESMDDEEKAELNVK